MKKTKSLIISAMIMVFALAFTACGSKSSSVEEAGVVMITDMMLYLISRQMVRNYAVKRNSA